MPKEGGRREIRVVPMKSSSNWLENSIKLDFFFAGLGIRHRSTFTASLRFTAVDFLLYSSLRSIVIVTSPYKKNIGCNAHSSVSIFVIPDI